MKAGWWFVLAGAALFTACAQPKGAREWTSIPPVQTVETQAFDVSLEPIKKGRPVFALFNLTIRNKGADPLILDWNRTRYLHNGMESGLFAFSGIDPGNLGTATIPPEVIPPGGTFQREIFPAGLVAYTPMREELLDAKGRGLFPGPLPAGKNGIRLSIEKNGRQTVQDVVVEVR